MGVIVNEVVGTVQRAPAPAGPPPAGSAAHQAEEALLETARRQLARQQRLERRARAD
jgi:hypothetical protein